MDRVETMSVLSAHYKYNDSLSEMLSEVMEQSDISHTIVFIMLTTFSLIGSFGNIMVIFVYINKQHKVASTVFIITLAYIDFFTCFLVIPFTVVMEYRQFHVAIDVVCKSYMFLITSTVPFSVLVMTSIAVDRYFCICRPLKKVMSVKKAKMTVGLLVAIAFLMGLLTSLGYGIRTRVDPNTANGKNSWQQQLNDLKIFYNDSKNTDNFTVLINEFNGIQNYQALSSSQFCQPNTEIFPDSFTDIYQKVYSGVFVVSVIIVFVLYINIYRAVSRRRQRRKRRTAFSSPSSSTIKRGVVAEVLGIDKTVQSLQLVLSGRQQAQERIRDRVVLANIRTAGILFAVTFIFIAVFLPAWLMALKLIEYNVVVFYMHFFYNVANPLVYAFMNKYFRRDFRILFRKKILRTVLKTCNV